MKKRIDGIMLKILEGEKEPTAGMIRVKLKEKGYRLPYDVVSKHLNMMVEAGAIGRKTIRDFVSAVDGKKHWGWHYYTLKNNQKIK